MSGYMNRVTLIGNLGADPELRHTQSGQKIVSMSIATSERWKDQRSGEARERTEWHRVVIFLCYREFATAGARDVGRPTYLSNPCIPSVLATLSIAEGNFLPEITAGPL